MKGRKRSLAAKIADRLIIWGLVITVCVGFVSYHYTLKYTDWMMVTVVPCRQIDVIGAMYVLKLMAFVLLGFLMLVAVAYIYIKTGIKLRYETDKLECKRPEGV